VVIEKNESKGNLATTFRVSVRPIYLKTVSTADFVGLHRQEENVMDHSWIGKQP
jgi:hypothetical protein